MARREIRLDQIDDYARENLSKLVKAAALYGEGQLKTRTPVDTGRLRSNWQTQINPLDATISNNLPYAEPVVAGTNLPPSWQGQYRTRQGAEPFLDIVSKNVQTYMEQEAARIGRQS